MYSSGNNVSDCYWQADDGRVFGSARSGLVASPSTDAALAAWKLFGYAPQAWPRNEAGEQSDDALRAVLAPYGLFLTRKDAMQAAVNAKRDAVIAAGYRHNFGGSAGIRTLDQRDARDETAWLSVKLMAADMVAAGQGASTISIRDSSNATFTCSANVAVSAMSAMGVWRSEVSAWSWALKDEIAAADDEDLATIDINDGWPE